MDQIHRRSLLGLLSLAPLAPCWAGPLLWAPSALGVNTRQGPVRGRWVDGVRAFTGIPYGRARRFGAPEFTVRRSAEWDATRPAPVAPQPKGGRPFEGQISEDCLYLNIWAPPADRPLPVFIWIHGGGNETGWSGEAAGDRFAAHGVICVTVNYRVGVLGFLELGQALGRSFQSSANNGIRDLILALQWVGENIAAFGGDPRRITIGGGSAGAKNVATLMGTPSADGLYAQAALFSGGAQTVHTIEEARAFARLYLEKLGGPDRLHDAPVDELIAAHLGAKAAWPRNFPFRPTVDGAFLPETPLARIARGALPRMPVLIGANADESRLFVPPDIAAGPLRPQDISNETMARMTALDQVYADAFPSLSVAQRHLRLLTAEEYGMPCLRIAEAHASRGADVWRYRLAYKAPGGPFAGSTPHALDGPFEFDHVQMPSSRFFGLSAADQPLADSMHGAVVGFVKHGNPQHPSLPAWPRYDATSRATMILDRQSTLASDPDRTERMLWQI